MVAVSVLVNHAAKDELMNHLLCTLFFYAAYYKFNFSAEHVPGALNVAADTLSWINVTLFSHLFVQHVPLQGPLDWSSVLFRLSLLSE